MPSTDSATAPPAQVDAAREALDAHVRDMVEWHFDPETGCPFWLDYARKLGWDPRREITTFADLRRLGACEPWRQRATLIQILVAHLGA